MLCRTSMHNTPFGELWINQRNSGFDSPYKFSEKTCPAEQGGDGELAARAATITLEQGTLPAGRQGTTAS